MTHAGRESRLAAGLAVMFALVAALAAVDLAADLRAGTTLRHVLVEGGLGLVGLAGFVWMLGHYSALVVRARSLEERAGDLAHRLAATREEAERWRREARDLIAGLGAAIDLQFERWGLSPAEKEVALLLLKGLSHKEVADVRGVNEATVRQQARALYRKAGLRGRRDLAAFFLEDLLAPESVSAADDATGRGGGPGPRP